MIFAIDPGNIRSAYVITDDDLKPVEFGIVENEELIDIIEKHPNCEFAIEMIASYGMPVGKEVFNTCVWIGCFFATVKRFGIEPAFVYRKEEKLCICQNMRAKDSNIRQALIDRFGVVGTKKNKGFFYGFKKDIWQAFAVAVTYHDYKVQ